MFDPKDDYLANYQYQWLIQNARDFWNIKLTQNPLVPLDPMNLSTFNRRHVAFLFKNAGLRIEELIESAQYLYIATVGAPSINYEAIPINDGTAALAREGFAKWLSDVTHTNAIDEGSGHKYDGSEINFSWLLSGLMHGLTRVDCDEPETEKCGRIVDYFRRHPFGTEPPVLSLISLLPTFDRIAILERLDPRVTSAPRYYEKLSMAYSKHGRTDLAEQAINQGWRMDLLSDDEFAFLAAKIDQVGGMENTSAKSHEESLFRLRGSEGAESAGYAEEFFSLLISYCEEMMLVPPF